MVKHSTVVKGDPAATYQILTDFPRYLEWYPECEKCDVITTSGSTTDVDMILGGMKVARMNLRYDCQPNLINYDMVSSNDLKGFKGSYRISDNGDGTHTVAMEVDLTASVPKFVTDRMMKSSLEKQGKQFQERNARVAGGGAKASAATVSAAASSPTTQPAVRAKRPRCLLRVKNTGQGTSIWYAGAEFHKSR
jgi:ribosome-associated toxin RatA of RatAB toxin-antitoxin module